MGSVNGRATRRIAAELETRVDVLRDTLDTARDFVLALRDRILTLEAFAKAAQDWRSDTVTPALQALNQKNQQQDTRLAALEARVTALENK